MFGRIAVLGAGAWGTALAHVAARPDRLVSLVCRDPVRAEQIGRARQNLDHLPGVTLDPGVVLTADPADVAAADLLLVAIPAQAVRAVLHGLPRLRSGIPVVMCAKGLEVGTGSTMVQVLAECRPAHPAGVLSGPSFAADVGRCLPTALSVAAADPALARTLALELGRPAFRLYFTTDVLGVELGGASKNVLAIACGMAAGLGLGASASAALIARSFAEMSRLGDSLGALSETLAGLAGLGDLVLTCSSPQSRNFSFGLRLARGEDPTTAKAGAVVEGAATAPVLDALARSSGVDMPIVAAVTAILAGTLTPAAALERLLARPLGPEIRRAATHSEGHGPWRTGC